MSVAILVLVCCAILFGLICLAGIGNNDDVASGFAVLFLVCFAGLFVLSLVNVATSDPQPASVVVNACPHGL